ncbi:hypothetical protein XBFFL1_300006 [Xenorhabdus bovienii str. feltiae Florida]|uniref:Uncharacterized protein n=1 Tax=Xenorhabdus bovienii str. oregonense TaxID=1398202 RepID=A0A077P242_XENBV|nr:hypothetical protein XBFFR1_1730006 [Xenorhabdus bovienii str. feltiae France]CDG94011.1 hypothetical protein XBFFL1_300006 [Xenorhabdus bovienii str. feltiae Florida]CDH04879.1 hypothetical protein XBO1_1510008 [Xenorhabdus bovienii str. oregonense]
MQKTPGSNGYKVSKLAVAIQTDGS